MILSNCCADAEAGLEQLSELELQLKLDWDAANGQSKTHSTGNFGFALRRHRQLCWQIDSRSPFRSRCGCLGICPVNRRRRQVAPSLNCTANPKFAVRRMSKTFKMREKLAAQGISLRFPQLLVCALHKRNLLITFRQRILQRNEETKESTNMRKFTFLFVTHTEYFSTVHTEGNCSEQIQLLLSKQDQQMGRTRLCDTLQYITLGRVSTFWYIFNGERV